MITDTTLEQGTAIFDSIRGTKDVLTVRSVFGEPYVVDGATVIPAAAVAGGAGGGGGEGPNGRETGSGFGTGFGMRARPTGVYVVRAGTVEWKPSVDVNRLVRGCQVLAGIVAVCLTLVALRRAR